MINAPITVFFHVERGGVMCEREYGRVVRDAHDYLRTHTSGDSGVLDGVREALFLLRALWYVLEQNHETRRIPTLAELDMLHGYFGVRVRQLMSTLQNARTGLEVDIVLVTTYRSQWEHLRRRVAQVVQERDFFVDDDKVYLRRLQQSIPAYVWNCGKIIHDLRVLEGDCLRYKRRVNNSCEAIARATEGARGLSTWRMMKKRSPRMKYLEEKRGEVISHVIGAAQQLQNLENRVAGRTTIFPDELRGEMLRSCSVKHRHEVRYQHRRRIAE